MMPPGFSATTPTTSWLRSWTVNATLVFAMVASPSTRATSRSRPKDGGWAYRRKVLSEPFGRSATSPNRVRLCDPPVRRSSPVDRRAVVLDVDRDRHPRPDPGVAGQHRPALHGQAVDRAGRRRQHREDQDRDGEREERSDQETSGDRPAAGAVEWRVSVAHMDSERRTGRDRSKDVSPRRKVASKHAGSPWAAPHRPGLSPSWPFLSYDALVPQPFGRSCRPPAHVAVTRRSRAPDPTLPRPALRSIRRRRPRHGRGPAVRRHRSRRARPPAGAPRGQRRPPGPALGCARRRARRPLSARGADAGRVAVRRDPAQGPPSVDLRLRTGVPRSRHRRRADPARVLRARLPRAVRAGDRRAGRTSGRCPVPRRTGTSSCGRPG